MTNTDFDNMVTGHSEYLKPYAISLTNDYENARDLFQETMLRAFMNRDKYTFGTNLKAWLYTIMRNIFINNYRRNKKLSKVTSDVPEDVIMYQASHASENEGWNNARMNEIKMALDQIPAVFRLSFELHYTGYKYQEIADILKEPLGTIKSRIHIARRLLVAKIER